MKTSQILKQQLFTEFQIKPQPIWNQPHEMLFLGSCFSDEISKRFENLFFKVVANPTGTLFSPLAIADTLCLIANNQNIKITEYNKKYYALLCNSDFQNYDLKTLQDQLTKSLNTLKNAIIQSETIFITLGSAFVYKYLESNEFVGNCHKIPQYQFSKELLTIQQIESSLDLMTKSIQSLNSNCKIIFTISPVRHLRDGISENLLSKSTLIVALQQFLNHHSEYIYFPSFEIFREELNDYRFFKDDLAHPNEWSISYIFNKLIECFGTEQFIKTLDEAIQLSTLLNHKPKTTNEEELKQFESLKIEKINAFSKKHPNLRP